MDAKPTIAQRLLRRMRSPAIVIPAMLAAAWLLSGCGLVDAIRDLGRTASSATDRALAVLDDAIDTLADASADWQVVLQDALDQLTEEAQSTIRHEVNDVLQRGIAAVSLNVRCDVDFLRHRVRQDLLRIRAAILGGEVPIEPVFCDVVPAAIDLSLPPDRRNLLEFFGYDFDAQPSVQVLLEQGGGTIDVSSHIDLPSHYHMTLNLGGSGVQLSSQSQRFVIRYGDRDLHTIGILQPFVEVCEQSTVRNSPSPITISPPLVEGDSEYSGHGPRITVTTTLLVSPSEIRALISMRARETKSDWTTADGVLEQTIYTAPSGMNILRLVGETYSEHTYTDSDHQPQTVFPGGPAHHYVIMGDGEGRDVERHTKTDVFFEDLQVDLVETGNCVPAMTFRTLQLQGALSEALQSRLIDRVRILEGLLPEIGPIGPILPAATP